MKKLALYFCFTFLASSAFALDLPNGIWCKRYDDATTYLKIEQGGGQVYRAVIGNGAGEFMEYHPKRYGEGFISLGASGSAMQIDGADFELIEAKNVSANGFQLVFADRKEDYVRCEKDPFRALLPSPRAAQPVPHQTQ